MAYSTGYNGSGQQKYGILQPSEFLLPLSVNVHGNIYNRQLSKAIFLIGKEKRRTRLIEEVCLDGMHPHVGRE